MRVPSSRSFASASSFIRRPLYLALPLFLNPPYPPPPAPCRAAFTTIARAQTFYQRSSIPLSRVHVSRNINNTREEHTAASSLPLRPRRSPLSPPLRLRERRQS